MKTALTWAVLQSHHTETVHALRTLLGGLWAKEKTPEAAVHLVQDNWN